MVGTHTGKIVQPYKCKRIIRQVPLHETQHQSKPHRQQRKNTKPNKIWRNKTISRYRIHNLAVASILIFFFLLLKWGLRPQTPLLRAKNCATRI